MDDVFHNGITRMELELKIENERSTFMGLFLLLHCFLRAHCLIFYFVDLQNTSENEQKVGAAHAAQLFDLFTNSITVV